MQAFVLRSARGKYFLLLLLTLALLAGSVLLAIYPNKPQDRTIGLLAAGLFGMGALLFLQMLFDRRPRIVIDGEGILDRSLKVGVIAWADIVDARLQSISRNHFIALSLRDAAKYRQKRSALSTRLVWLNKSLGFSEFNINLGGVAADPQAVLELILQKIAEAPASDPSQATSATTPAPCENTRADAQAELRDFAARLAQIGPRTWVTPLLLLANGAMFVLIALDGGGVLKPVSDVILRWGANYGPSTSDGQWWRLGSSMFIHFGLLHLALNMWALYSVGPLVERLFGSLRFATLYGFAGLAGSTASVLWHPNTISAGASGAIFGVFGALLSFMLKPQNRIPPSVMSGQLRSTLAFVVFNLIFGATQPGIDNAAHLGGLAGGAIIGLALARPFDIEIRRRSGWLAYSLTLTAAIALLAALSWPITHPSAAARAEQSFRRDLRWFETHEGTATDRFNEKVKALNQRTKSAALIADELDAEILPLWDELHAHVASADVSSNAQLQALQRAYLDYIEHRRQAIALIAKGIKQNDGDQLKNGEALLKRGDADIEAISDLRKAGD